MRIAFITAVLFFSSAASSQDNSRRYGLGNEGPGEAEIRLMTESRSPLLFCPLPTEIMEDLILREGSELVINYGLCQRVVDRRASLFLKIPKEAWNKVLPVGVAVVPHVASKEISPDVVFLFIEPSGKVRRATPAEINQYLQPRTGI